MASQQVTSQNASLWRVRIVLTLGVFCVSTAAIFIRMALNAAETDGLGFSLMLASSRLAIAALILTPTWRTLPYQETPRRALGYSLGAGVLLAIHFAVWTTSLSYTSIAASTTLVTTIPVWVALLSWLWFGEALSLKTMVGIGITLVGGACIGLQNAGTSIGSNPLLGNALALMGAGSISVHFLLGREAQRGGLSLTNHVAIAYSTAAVTLLPLPPLFGSPYLGYPAPVYLWIILMALVSQLIGHTSINWAVHQISPTLVTLSILMEPVGASLLAYFVFGEIPGVQVGIGALLILSGVAIAALGMNSAPTNAE